ncbi:MAG: DUF354 domain-containing protein [Acidobacteriota bacterium]
MKSQVIWIDLDNTPHVPFFIPIIAELTRRGYRVVLTARDAFQVCELATQSGLAYTKIGHHYGKHLSFKVFGWLWRSAQLLPFALKEKPDLALSHGARSQLLLANLLRIPTVLIMDYEHARTPPFCRPKWEIVPDVISSDDVPCKRVLKYAGIKEDVYAETLQPAPGLLETLGLSETDLIVTVRPPATEAHYHNAESEILLAWLIDWILSESEAKIVLLPRNRRQTDDLKEQHPEWFGGGRLIIPQHAVDGMNLLWHSDVVVSGGGTMNREAAALGVPVHSIFRGPLGAVDRSLSAQGRLSIIKSVSDIPKKVALVKRPSSDRLKPQQRKALSDIVSSLDAILAEERRKG